MQKVKFKVNNLHHNSSALLIEEVMKNQPGIIKIKVDFESKKGVVMFDEQKRSDDDIIKTIEDINSFNLEKIVEVEEENNINDIKKEKYMETPKQSSSNPKVIMAMAIVLIAMGLIAFGKGGTLNPSNNNQLPTDIGQQQNNQPTVPSEPAGPVKVSVDDDAVLGDKNAPVTLIEFVDYECPFCKSFFDQTFPQIKKNYIDTGKVKFVMRDLPLSFHQNAHKESQAAECAREQGGDSAYFKYHDEIFKRTISNGTGLALTQLSVIANDLGLNGNNLQSCLDSEKYKAEVDKDLADASKAGANGTPTFFVGKSDSSGAIDGQIVVGAQPYSAFQVVIDQMLSQ